MSPEPSTHPPSLEDPLGRPSDETSAAGEPERYACDSDDDCRASCSQGAVSRRWYAQALPGGESCEDGCAGLGMSARCEQGSCVAYQNDGSGATAYPACTMLVREIERPGPAHSCAQDGDCTLRCDTGAVNAAQIGWFVTLGPDCRGGCTSSGHSVRCDEGRCLALRMGEPDPQCTERPIWGER
jgi:hypothetical protein